MLYLSISNSFWYSSFSRHHLFRVRNAPSLGLKARRPYFFPLDQGRVTGSGSCHSRFSTMSPSETIQYNWIDGVERLELYEPGGYHPVVINDLLHHRYRIVDK